MIVKGKERYLRHEGHLFGRGSNRGRGLFFLGGLEQLVALFAVLYHDAHFNSQNPSFEIPFFRKLYQDIETLRILIGQMHVTHFFFNVGDGFYSKRMIFILTADKAIDSNELIVAADRHVVVLYLLHVVQSYTQPRNKNTYVHLLHIFLIFALLTHLQQFILLLELKLLELRG